MGAPVPADDLPGTAATGRVVPPDDLPVPTMTVKPETAGVMERFGTGLIDPVVGGAQLLEHGADVVGLAKPINRFNNWLAEKTGLVAPIPEGGMDQVVKEREAAIRKSEPKGMDWARLLGGVLSPVNLAVPGGGLATEAGIAGRIGMAAAQGAGVGMLQPAAGEGFVGQKVGQAGMGFLAGGTIGAASEVISPVVSWLRGVHGDTVAGDKAAQTILDRIQKDEKGGGPTMQQMLDLANLTPEKPMMLGDVAGVNTQGLLGKVARAPGEAKQIIAKAMNDRAIDASLRLGDDITDSLGGGAAYTIDKALVKARSEAAKPLFEKAYAVKPIYDARIDQYLQQPEIQEGIRRGWTNERREAIGEGRAPNPADYAILYFDEQGHPVIAPVPNMRLLAVAKEGLDAMLEDMKEPLTGNLNKAGVALKKFRNGFVDALDKLNPLYKTARNAWSGGTDSFLALREGQDLFNLEPEKIRDLFQNEYTENDREFFRLGAANAMRKMVGGTEEMGEQTGLPLGMPKGNPAKRIAGSPRQRQQMRAMFDNDAEFDKFFQRLNSEHMMYQNWQKIYGGSQTAERMGEDLRGELYAGSHAVRVGGSLVRGHPIEAASHGLQALTAVLPKTHPKVAAAQARLLTKPTPEAIKALRDAAGKIPTIRVTPWMVPGAAAAVTPDFGEKQ